MRLFIIVIAVSLSLVPIIYTLLTILEEKIKLKSYSRGKAIAELEHREAIQLYKEFLNGEIEVKHKSRVKIRRVRNKRLFRLRKMSVLTLSSRLMRCHMFRQKLGYHKSWTEEENLQKNKRKK